MNDSFVWTIREIFKILNQNAVDIPTLPVNLRYSPLFRDPGGMLSRSLEIPSRKNGPPTIWDTHGKSGNVVANPTASSSAPFPQELNPWSSNFLNTHHHMWWVKTKHQFKIRDASQDRQPENSVIPREGECSKNYEATTTADLRSSFRQIHHASNVCLLEDKIQDWGMYLFTISCGSYAVDQRSGDGWFSGWFQILVFCKRNSNARFWGTRCEGCVSTEQNHPWYTIQKEGQPGGTKSPKRGPLSSWKTDRLPDLRVLPGHWSQWFRRELCRPIYNCSSNSGIRFEMWRNFIINDENPIWWHLGRIVQTKNTRVWETQDRIGIVQYGDSSEKDWTWLSQIEDNGKKKYRARCTKQEFWGQKRKFWNKRRGQES